MRDLTLIYPYYDNPVMLKLQLQHLAALPKDIRAHLDLIVVDDGSPKCNLAHYLWPPADSRSHDMPAAFGLHRLEVYRIEVDVRWNWIAARNLAASKTKTNWMLMTDIDHMVPEATFRRIMEGELETLNTYRFSRVDAPDRTPYKPHPNSWLFTKKRFDQAGGYDERFSGYYGTDGEFRDRITAVSKKVVMLPQALIRYPREVVADASTTTYERKQPEDREGVTRIRQLIAADPTPHRLTFPWRQIL